MAIVLMLKPLKLLTPKGFDASFDELDERYGFPPVGRFKVAINEEFGDWDAALADGDSVVFIPPVAGG